MKPFLRLSALSGAMYAAMVAPVQAAWGASLNLDLGADLGAELILLAFVLLGMRLRRLYLKWFADSAYGYTAGGALRAPPVLRCLTTLQSVLFLAQKTGYVG